MRTVSCGGVITETNRSYPGRITLPEKHSSIGKSEACQGCTTIGRVEIAIEIIEQLRKRRTKGTCRYPRTLVGA